MLGYESSQIAKPIDGMVIDGDDLAPYAVNFVNVTTFNAFVANTVFERIQGSVNNLRPLAPGPPKLPTRPVY